MSLTLVTLSNALPGSVQGLGSRYSSGEELEWHCPCRQIQEDTTSCLQKCLSQLCLGTSLDLHLCLYQSEGQDVLILENFKLSARPQEALLLQLLWGQGQPALGPEARAPPHFLFKPIGLTESGGCPEGTHETKYVVGSVNHSKRQSQEHYGKVKC